ncbi:MAG: hypothetical protein KDE59_25920 [Anaerolineales bacterium]|nr:hypothetical protein [Anaerolineales bacterium]
MNIITYQIELLEPVLVTALQGDPNSGVAFDYLPGSVLRGAIISRFRQSEQLDIADEKVQRLFFNGHTRYLNGYPLDDRQRALPIPHAWHRAKEEETPLYDFAVEAGDPQTDWQRPHAPFWLPVGSQARLITPDRHIAVHIARDRHLGRDDDGVIGRAVYRYDALAPGQTFAAAILCDDDELAAVLLPLLSGKWSLGGSRSGGYGRVYVSHARQLPDPATWRETGGELETADHLTITCLSDALLRDASGQAAVSPKVVTQAVAQALGIETLTCRQSFLSATTVGGFNRKWGLPLPQVPAVGMGSVFVFDPPDCALDKLYTLEQTGIGERRTEGFGRVAVNWLAQETWPVETEDAKHKPPPPPVKLPADSPAAEIAGAMAARLLRKQIENRIADQATGLGASLRGVKRSQLNRLRLLIQDALYQEPQAGRQLLNDYLVGVGERKVTRSQFDRAKVGSEPLLLWLEKRFDHEKGRGVWQDLRVNATESKIGDVTPDLADDNLVYEYNLRLAEAVLARAAKEEER